MITFTTNARHRAATLLLASAAAFMPTAAMADTASSSLSVSATVTKNCTVSTSPINFGSINTTTGAAVGGTGGLSIVCTSGTDWDASAGVGAGSGASFSERFMGSGGNVLGYNLYTDSGYSSVWGDGTASTVLVSDTGSGVAQSVTIYGRVGSGQTSVPAGSYSDSVSVTVTY